MFRSLTPSRLTALQIMQSYPLVFLAVGLAVLFLKVEDRNAWLLALFFAGFIAMPDVASGVIPSGLGEFSMAFHLVPGSLAFARVVAGCTGAPHSSHRCDPHHSR